MPNARSGCRCQAPQPRSGAPKAQGLRRRRGRSTIRRAVTRNPATIQIGRVPPSRPRPRRPPLHQEFLHQLDGRDPARSAATCASSAPWPMRAVPASPHALAIRCLLGAHPSIRARGYRGCRGRAEAWPDSTELTRRTDDPHRLGRGASRSRPETERTARAVSVVRPGLPSAARSGRGTCFSGRGITYRLRYARGDLFLGPYRHGPVGCLGVLSEILERIAARLSQPGAATPRHPTGLAGGRICCRSEPVAGGQGVRIARYSELPEI